MSTTFLKSTNGQVYLFAGMSASGAYLGRRVDRGMASLDLEVVHNPVRFTAEETVYAVIDKKLHRWDSQLNSFVGLTLKETRSLAVAGIQRPDMRAEVDRLVQVNAAKDTTIRNLESELARAQQDAINAKNSLNEFRAQLAQIRANFGG